MHRTNMFIPNSHNARKIKIAFVGDLDRIVTGKHSVGAAIRAEARYWGCNPVCADLGELLGGLVRYTGAATYQIDLKHIGRKLSRIFHLPEYSRGQLSKLEGMLEYLGYIRVARHKVFGTNTCVKIRKFTQKFIDLVFPRDHERWFRVDETDVTYLTTLSDNSSLFPQRQLKLIDRDTAKDSVVPVFNKTPLRARDKDPVNSEKPRSPLPARPSTYFDGNHMTALAAHGCKLQRPRRVDRQLLFHIQSAIGNAYEALKLFIRTVDGRDAGDAKTVAWFNEWRKLPKGMKTHGILTLYGDNAIEVMPKQSLARVDKQILFHCCRTSKSVVEALRLFVKIIHEREVGHPAVLAFMGSWEDLLQAPKAGMLRELGRALGIDAQRQSMPEPPIREEGVLLSGTLAESRNALRSKALNAALDVLPGSIVQEEVTDLLAALLPGSTYDGPHPCLLARMRDLCDLELDILTENLIIRIKNSPDDP